MSTPDTATHLTDDADVVGPVTAADPDPTYQPAMLPHCRPREPAAEGENGDGAGRVLPLRTTAGAAVPHASPVSRLAPVEAISPLLATSDALVQVIGYSGLALMQASHFEGFVLIGMIGILVFVQFSRLFGTRQISRPRHRRNMIGRTAACLFMVALALKASILLLGLETTLGLSEWAWLLAMALTILATRLVAVETLGRWRAEGKTVQHVACIGANRIAAETIAAIEADDEHEMALVGVFDDRTRPRSDSGYDLPTHGSVGDLFGLLERERIDIIVIALPWSAERRILEILRRLRNVPSEVVLAPELNMVLRPALRPHEQGLRLVEVQGQPLARGNRILKETLERALALILLIWGLPVFALIALAIKLDSRGPVLFRQDRRGLGGAVFRVFKFRTFFHDCADAGAVRQTEKNDPRVTRVGAVLRKTSLDELPQLINVLLGHMALVGPRPYALEMRVDKHLVRDILQEYLLRNHVKPGITGWAQVNGSYGPVYSLEELIRRTELDAYYIRNWSLGLDMQILLQTVRLVLTGRSNA